MNRKTLLCAAFVALACPFHATAGSVTLAPGDTIQASVDAAPPGTTFLLAAGLYRMQSVRPKDNDVFQGQGNVVLNGSQILSFTQAGSLWAAAATADNFRHGNCQAAFPLCGYGQDLFIDGVYQEPSSDKGRLAMGSWYFDRANGRVYLPVSPQGHTVELGMTHYAFYGPATGVKIDGLVIEKYASPAQTGAVGGDSWGKTLGPGWSLHATEVRWNHGAGVYLGAGGSVAQCRIHHNGQIGVKLTGAGGSVIGNEIAWNNQQGFVTGWEAGGSKFWATTNLLVQSNYVHDNLGEGLWSDTDNIHTTYENNRVENNLSGGIMHEVSYAAVIRNNIVRDNAPSQRVWLENAQILVQNSSDVQIYGNSVQVPAGGGNGITLVNQKRGNGKFGPWVVANDSVHDNTITYLGAAGVSGLADDTKPHTSYGNTFDANRYILNGGGTTHWYWYYGMNWQQFAKAQQEAHGHCCN